MLQVLARSATGERMNPYTRCGRASRRATGRSAFMWCCSITAARQFWRAERERQTLRCIRCGACKNACPVYRQTGGHAYGSVYAGPIGAILTPQLTGMKHAQSLPFASSLCGVCYEVCPVKINIPEVLIDLRAQVTDQERGKAARFFDPMYLGMRVANLLFSRALALSARRNGWVRIGLRLSRAKMDGFIRCPAWAQWTMTRDLRGLPMQTFREWWAARQGGR